MRQFTETKQLTPWEMGYAMFGRGEIARIPTSTSTWRERLINAGWCAARREKDDAR